MAASGESGGGRGLLPSRSRLLDDLADIIDSTRLRMSRRAPLIVLGHSLGGLVAGHFVAQAIRPVDGLVMSSPALNPGLSAVRLYVKRTDLAPVIVKTFTAKYKDGSKITVEPGVPVLAGKVAFHEAIVPVVVPESSLGVAYAPRTIKPARYFR